MKYKVIIKIDTNDADYMEVSYTIEEERADEIRTMLSRINRGADFNKEDYLITSETKAANPTFTEEDWDWFADFLPSGGELSYGYSSLESVCMIPFESEEVLF